MDENFLRYLRGSSAGFNPYGAGNKIYGGGSNAPTTGAVDPTGYRERDLAGQARKKALLARLQAGVQQRFTPTY